MQEPQPCEAIAYVRVERTAVAEDEGLQDGPRRGVRYVALEPISHEASDRFRRAHRTASMHAGPCHPALGEEQPRVDTPPQEVAPIVESPGIAPARQPVEAARDEDRIAARQPYARRWPAGYQNAHGRAGSCQTEHEANAAGGVGRKVRNAPTQVHLVTVGPPEDRAVSQKVVVRGVTNAAGAGGRDVGCDGQKEGAVGGRASPERGAAPASRHRHADHQKDHRRVSNAHARLRRDQNADRHGTRRGGGGVSRRLMRDGGGHGRRGGRLLRGGSSTECATFRQKTHRVRET